MKFNYSDDKSKLFATINELIRVWDEERGIKRTEDSREHLRRNQLDFVYEMLSEHPYAL